MNLKQQLNFILDNNKIENKEHIIKCLEEAAKANLNYTTINVDTINNKTLEWLRSEGLTVVREEDFRDGDYYKISW